MHTFYQYLSFPVVIESKSTDVFQGKPESQILIMNFVGDLKMQKSQKCFIDLSTDISSSLGMSLSASDLPNSILAES